MKKSTMQMTKHEKMDFQQQRFDIQQRETKEQAVQIEQVKPVVNILNVEVKSRKQIEMERDEMVQITINNYQKEAEVTKQRIKEEEDRRKVKIQQEKERMEKEFELKQEVFKRKEEERKREHVRKQQAIDEENRNREINSCTEPIL